MDKNDLCRVMKNFIEWLEPDAQVAEIDDGIIARISVDVTKGGDYLPTIYIKDGHDQDFSSLFYRLVNNQLNQSLINIMTKELGSDRVADIVQSMMDTYTEEADEEEELAQELEDMVLSEPVIRPSEVFNEQ